MHREAAPPCAIYIIRLYTMYTRRPGLFEEGVAMQKRVSQAFVRFPGRTPWKRIGELSSTTGDFEEAIRCQWTLMLRRSFNLYPKVRFWLPSDQPIEFGYADENADIVSVKDPLPEGIWSQDLKQMLNRCGFLGGEKEMVYQKGQNVRKAMWGPHGLKKGWHLTGRSQLQYRDLLRQPENAQKWANRAIQRNKYQVKGTGIRAVDWFGGMGRWAVKSHFQGVVASNNAGSVRKTKKQLKYPSGGRDNVQRKWLHNRALRTARPPEGIPRSAPKRQNLVPSEDPRRKW
ncbi:unnamed protein product [Prorocentrum cordatum]|uniref:Uncharacterized protein n=1 Tax=Prorocentrum cordatum TaxID=2364126 RepID=A0ABN9W6C9_9DINO|nr:unnamed protein product [Polarella glacialis]